MSVLCIVWIRVEIRVTVAVIVPQQVLPSGVYFCINRKSHADRVSSLFTHNYALNKVITIKLTPLRDRKLTDCETTCLHLDYPNKISIHSPVLGCLYPPYSPECNMQATRALFNYYTNTHQMPALHLVHCCS